MVSDNPDFTMPRVKRLLQFLFLSGLIVYASLVYYHRTNSKGPDKAGTQEIGWQERAPRSLSGDYQESMNLVEVVQQPVKAATAATPPQPYTTSAASLSDVFISVKTTVHYHKPRLPIILKTWFQLAKQQVIKPL
ncbi:hypothetical protein AAG570_000562 [Ranatra chinensis]|uniref:Fringe-like glycosyltransferase domain-containing protein n=1 Tax=Ranatra chinensis TaxID=642074 RepID=A0ABD0ZA47_9HEMI